jgi:hypothetical protein
MDMHIRFLCEDCGKENCNNHEMNLKKYKPAWARIAGYDAGVAWMGEGRVTQNKSAMSMVEPPVAGNDYTLEVTFPFRTGPGDHFWVLFQPPDSAINGWEDFPHELECSRVVQCRPAEVTKRNKKSCGLLVNVLDSIGFREIANRFPKGSGPVPPYPGKRNIRITWKDLIYLTANLESDAAAWFICRRQGEQSTMLLYGTSGRHEDFFYAGHRPLHTAEFKSLENDFIEVKSVS